MNQKSFEEAISVFCDKYCRYPVECQSQDELDEHCDFIRIINEMFPPYKEVTETNRNDPYWSFPYILKNFMKKGTKEMENCIVLNGKKTDLTAAQVESIRSSLSLNTKLSEYKPEETCHIGKREFIVLGHDDSDGSTALALNGFIDVIRFGDNSNFADENNDIRKSLYEFQKEMEALVGAENLIEHDVDLTANDGMKCYGSINLKMSVMTAEQRRKYAYTMDKFKTDEHEWLSTSYSTPEHGYGTLVMCVSPSGFINYYYCDCINFGVRPFCILNSNIFVSK